MNSKKIFFAMILLLPASFITFSSAQNTREVTMEGHDNMKYTVEQITVKPGSKVKVTLKTVSNLPKAQMAHNFVLLKKDTDVESFAMESIKHKDNDYIAPGMTGQILAQTEMLGDGETDSVTFTAPEKPGDYIYICTFPGHYQAGMKGVLTVKN